MAQYRKILRQKMLGLLILAFCEDNEWTAAPEIPRVWRVVETSSIARTTTLAGEMTWVVGR